MKAVRIAQTGAPNVLELVDIETPIPPRGHILVKVEACGINYADTVRRRGLRYPMPTPLPIVLGGEVAGTVTAVGEEVTLWRKGDRIIGLMDHGGYAEFAVVPEKLAWRAPSELSAETLAALFVQGMTALCILEIAANLKAGQTVFVEGAAGGAGGLAIQLSRHLGAGKVVGGVSSMSKDDAARANGADAVADYTLPDWPEQARRLNGDQGFDLVLHSRGGEAFGECLRLLRPGGRVVIFGAASGKPMMVDATAFLGAMPGIAPNTGVTGFFLGAYFSDREFIQARFDRLVALVVSGELRVSVGGVFTLAEAASAHQQLESRLSTGKLILRP